MFDSGELRLKFVYRLSLYVALTMLAIAAVTSLAQAYIRWTLNQDFTFFGGNVIEALILSATALLVTLLIITRRG